MKHPLTDKHVMIAALILIGLSLVVFYLFGMWRGVPGLQMRDKGPATPTYTLGSSQPLELSNNFILSKVDRVPKTDSLYIEGKATGSWFFEAQFPFRVYDANDVELATGIASANGDWMTSSFVPFTATVTLPAGSVPAKIVFRKDNPSGLPENDLSIAVMLLP